MEENIEPTQLTPPSTTLPTPHEGIPNINESLDERKTADQRPTLQKASSGRSKVQADLVMLRDANLAKTHRSKFKGSSIPLTAEEALASLAAQKQRKSDKFIPSPSVAGADAFFDSWYMQQKEMTAVEKQKKMEAEKILRTYRAAHHQETDSRRRSPTPERKWKSKPYIPADAKSTLYHVNNSQTRVDERKKAFVFKKEIQGHDNQGKDSLHKIQQTLVEENPEDDVTVESIGNHKEAQMTTNIEDEENKNLPIDNEEHLEIANETQPMSIMSTMEIGESNSVGSEAEENKSIQASDIAQPTTGHDEVEDVANEMVAIEEVMKEATLVKEPTDVPVDKNEENDEVIIEDVKELEIKNKDKNGNESEKNVLEDENQVQREEMDTNTSSEKEIEDIQNEIPGKTDHDNKQILEEKKMEESEDRQPNFVNKHLNHSCTKDYGSVYSIDSDAISLRYVQKISAYRNLISSEENAKFQSEPNRYHLYTSMAPPWAHRTMLVRAIKGLEDVISFTVLHPIWQYTKPNVDGDDHRGWMFADPDGEPFINVAGLGGPFPAAFDGNEPDVINHCSSIREVYEKANDTVGKYTVPVLWDKKLGTIVSNESSEIIRMFNREFNSFAKYPDIDLYPDSERKAIDSLNKWIYPTFNNGVYRCGLATTQEEYQEAVTAVTNAFDKIEGILKTQRFLAGENITEADIRLFPTLLRFDEIYNFMFKTNARMVKDSDALLNYCREIYQMPGVAETCDMEQIKYHYYCSHVELNRFSIVPIGTGFMELLSQPHNRESIEKA